MKKRKKAMVFSPARFAGTGLMAAIVLFLGVNLLFAVPSSNPPLFKGYHTVYYRGQRPLPDLVDYLRSQADIDAVISRESAQVLFTDFSELVPLPLRQVEKRFDALDPRLDDYLKNIGRYFTLVDADGSWNVLYVASRRNPLSLSVMLRDFSGARDGDWRILELDNNETTVLVATAGALFFLALMLASKKPAFHLLLGAGILPWMFALTRGGISDFLLFFFISYYWAGFLNVYLDFIENRELNGWKDRDRKPLWLRLVLYAGVVVFTFVFTSLYKSDLLEVTLALFAQTGLVAAHWGLLRGLRWLKKKKLFRSLAGFKPLPILRSFAPRKKQPDIGRLAATAAVGLLVLMPAVLLFKPAIRESSRPVPEARTNAEGINLAAVRLLGAAKKEGDLPDLSDFITHAAYQERLAFDAAPVYVLPEENESIVISTYRINATNVRVERTPALITAFNEAWLRRLEERVARISVERMLFDQGRCLSVSLKNAAADGAFDRYNWTIVLIWVIVLCPIVLLRYTALSRFILGRRTVPTNTENAVKRIPGKKSGAGRRTTSVGKSLDVTHAAKPKKTAKTGKSTRATRNKK